MHTPVCLQSAAVVPEHSPRTVKPVDVERAVRCGSQPHVEIHAFGYWLIGHGRFSCSVMEVGPDLHGTDLSKPAGLHELYTIFPFHGASLLLADLYYPVIFFRCPDHDIAFCKGVGQWLFHIYILAGFTGKS